MASRRKTREEQIQQGKRLAERMAQDAALVRATEHAFKGLEEGRYSKLEDVKRELGDV